MTGPADYDFLILGADAAGLSAAVQIRSSLPDSRVAVLDRGEIISYGACGLPYAIEGKIESFDALIHFTAESFSAKTGAEVHTGTEALHLDPATKTVQARKDGKEVQYRYNRLLIATGAEAIRPAEFDFTSDRIFTLKSIPDGRAIQESIQKHRPKSAVIVGAGYIGLEMADVLKNQGMEVTVLEMGDRPVARMPELIGKTVTGIMEEKGIPFHPGSRVSGCQVHEDRVELTTASGSFQGELVIVGAGIRPATGFLENTGIAMERGASVVDRRGMTSVKDVFAAGDCALAYHRLLGKNVYMPLGSTANKQGRIAGQNLSGIDIEFPGILGTQVFKFFDRALAFTGLTPEEAKSLNLSPRVLSASRPGKAGYYPGAGKTTVDLVVEESTGRILGGALAGPLHAASGIDTIAAFALGEVSATDAAYFDAAYAPPFAPVWNAIISAAGKYGRK